MILSILQLAQLPLARVECQLKHGGRRFLTEEETGQWQRYIEEKLLASDDSSLMIPEAGESIEELSKPSLLTAMLKPMRQGSIET